MKALKNLKIKIGEYVLKRKLKGLKRKPKSIGLKQAAKVGVIYNATNRSDYEIVKKFIQYLIEERKEVSSLGFINLKDSSQIVKPHLNYSFFDLTQLNKVAIPNSIDVDKFIETRYDMLVDLTLEDVFPVKYVASLSKSRFKVGASIGYRDEICDLVIDIKDQPSLDYLIIQIKHYVNLLK